MGGDKRRGGKGEGGKGKEREGGKRGGRGKGKGGEGKKGGEGGGKKKKTEGRKRGEKEKEGTEGGKRGGRKGRRLGMRTYSFNWSSKWTSGSESGIALHILSRHRAKIIFHEKVVRIPLPHGKMLRVYGERPEEKVKHLMSAKTEEQKLKDIVVIQNFSEAFPDDLSGLHLPKKLTYTSI
ncbi:hypothetical protein Tco_0684687 [Tanacetum coccineum]